MGDKDFIKPLLERRGVVFFGKVCMKPGKPLTFAKVPVPEQNRCAGYAVLCCAVLCCAVLCCAVLCCAVLCWRQVAFVKPVCAPMTERGCAVVW